MNQPNPLTRRFFVQVCQNRTCLRSQSDQVLAAFCEYRSAEVMVTGSECLGQCASGPTVKVMPDNTWYCRVQPGDVAEIAEQHLQAGQPVKRLLHPRFHPNYDHFFQGQGEDSSAAPPIN